MDQLSRTRLLARWATFLLVGVLLLATLAAAFVGYWFSGLGERRAMVESYLADRLDVPVSIGRIMPGWHGIAPQIKAMDVAIGSGLEGPPALTLDELDLTLEPLSLVFGEPTIRELALLGPRLELERLADGRIRLAQIDRLGSLGEKSAWRELLRHRELRIVDGTLVWKDHFADEAPLTFSDVALTARRRGAALAVSARAAPPVSLGGPLRLEAALPGVDAGSVRDAHVALSMQSVDLVQLPAVLAERLPLSAGGFADMQGWMQWHDGVLSSAFTTLEISQPSALLEAPVQILAAARRLRVDAAWHRTAHGWSLELEPVRVRPWGWADGAADARWLHGPVEIVHAGEATRIRVPRLVLDVLDGLLAPGETDDVMSRLRALQPSGELRNLELELMAGAGTLQLASFETDIHDLGILPGDRTPGIAGIDGHATGDLERGSFRLESSDVQLDYPRVFREVLDITRLTGEIAWHREPADGVGMRITGTGLEAATAHVKATASLRLETADRAGTAPFVQASGEFGDGDAAHTSRYLPAGIMPPKAVRWLDRAIVSGTVPSGSFAYSGRTDRFPFKDADAQGRFRVSFQVRDAVLDYEPGWPRLESADAVLTFEGASMRAEGASGEIAGLTLDTGHASIADLKTPQPVLELAGSLSGGFAPVIDFLRTGPISDHIGLDSVAVTGRGRGSTELALTIPLKAAHTTAVNGRYHFEDAALHFSSGIVIDNLRGGLDYARTGLSAEGIEGSMLGGPVSIDVVTEDAGSSPGTSPRIALIARGHARAAELEPVLGKRLTAALDGDADWNGRMEIERGAANLQVASTLEGVAVSLPPPIAKSADSARALRVDVRYAGAIAAAEARDDGERRQVTRFRAGHSLGGVLAFVDRDGWKPERGQLVLGGGEPRLPAEAGLVVQVVLPGLELDPWLAFLQPEDGGVAQGGDGEGNLHVRRIDASIDALTWLDRSFDDVQAALVRDGDGGWSGMLSGTRVQGRLSIAEAGAGRRVKADLQRLFWPRARDGGDSVAEPAANGERTPSELPTLDVSAGEFRFDSMQLGELRLAGAPRGDAWTLETLRLTRPDLVVAGDGVWRTEGDASRSHVELEAHSGNLGSALTALDIRQVAGGSATATASLSWAGGFDALSWQRLEGSYALNASDGRFLKVEPGVGRAFGLLNIESLTRRLRLDFSDLYSKGFSFDRIDSQGTIGDGELRLVQHYVSGPAALIEMQGLVGLVARDYDLTMTVVPEVGDNLSVLGGVLGGPAAGALIFLAQKVFQNQLANMVHYRYRISGAWENPEVTRFGTPAGEQRPERIGDRSSPESLTRPGGRDGGS